MPWRSRHGAAGQPDDRSGSGGSHRARSDRGASTGLLAHVVEVLRLNARRRPDRTCDLQATPIVNVPYQAYYVFING